MWRIARASLIGLLLVPSVLYGGMTAQQPTAPQDLEIPLYPDAQLEFEFLLTEEDFIGGIQELLEAFLEGSRRLPVPPPFPTLPPDPGLQTMRYPEAYLFFLYYTVGYAYSQAFGEFFQKMLEGLEEFRVVVYTLSQAGVAEVMGFYDQHFSEKGWRRNLWMRQPDGMNGRLFSLSQAGRLRATAFIWAMQLSGRTTVTLISTRSR